SPVMEDGTHTDVYYALKEVLRSVQARADIFLHSDVKWVRHTTGTNKRAKKWWRTNEVPAANERFRTSDLGSDPITDLSTDITALVSRFSSNGDEYLMVVSKDHTETFDLEFTNTKKIYSVDKKGQLGAITPGDHTLTIDKGDCVIFKLND
ncbi:MAG: hypothetical protein HUJ91_07295, partial [Bacteroidales bacterium]|nr:hypothetical protein [Bacteroidales bacterium]